MTNEVSSNYLTGVNHKILRPEPDYQIGHKIPLGFLAPYSQFLGARTMANINLG